MLAIKFTKTHSSIKPRGFFRNTSANQIGAKEKVYAGDLRQNRCTPKKPPSKSVHPQNRWTPKILCQNRLLGQNLNSALRPRPRSKIGVLAKIAKRQKNTVKKSVSALRGTSFLLSQSFFCNFFVPKKKTRSSSFFFFLNTHMFIISYLNNGKDSVDRGILLSHTYIPKSKKLSARLAAAYFHRETITFNNNRLLIPQLIHSPGYKIDHYIETFHRVKLGGYFTPNLDLINLSMDYPFAIQTIQKAP